MQPCNHATIQPYKHTNIETYKHTSIQAYKHTSIQTYKHTSIQACNHANIQTYKHTSIQTCNHATMQPYKHTNIQTYKHTRVQPYNRTNVQMYKRTNRQTLREICSKFPRPSLAHESKCGWEGEQLQSLLTPATGDVYGKLQARSLYLLGKEAVWGPTTELNAMEKRNLSCSRRVASPDTCVFKPIVWFLHTLH